MAFDNNLGAFLTLMAIVFAIPWIIMGAVYIKIHKGYLKDRFNLRFRRSSVIKVNFQTRTGRNIERYIVPDKHSLLHINGGTYAYIEELSTINTRYRIPEITLLQSQIHPPIGDVIEVQGQEVEISVPQPDGTLKKEKRKVPNYVISYASKKPETLNGHIAEEIQGVLDSHIVSDILTASNAYLRKIELLFIIACVCLVLIILFGFILIGMLNGIQNDLEMIKLANLAPNGL